MDVEGNSFRLTSALVELAFFLILAALSAFFWVMWKVYRLILEWLEPPFGHSAHGRGHCSAHGPPFGHSANGVVRLGARRACTTALAITSVFAVRTPRAGSCGLVQGELAPLPLPSLWLLPSGHHEPGCAAWCMDRLRHCPCHRSGCHRQDKTSRKIWAGSHYRRASSADFLSWSEN
ncbi:uncharacterized protein [Dermacentor andersoni]|uniref:uncharacterized protein isoform X2 n=1 Tax=Dermacentor andersoni TaxID=34620 RepID=UPI003B3AE4CE